MPKKIVPSVIFQSPSGVRQEVLPEVNVDEILSLGYDYWWNDMKPLTLRAWVLDEKSYSLLSGTPAAALVIKDSLQMQGQAA